MWVPENMDLLTWISSETRLSFIFDHLGAVWPLPNQCFLVSFFTVKLFYRRMAILRGTVVSDLTQTSVNSNIPFFCNLFSFSLNSNFGLNSNPAGGRKILLVFYAETKGKHVFFGFD